MNNPCGRCNYSCIDDSIQCVICLRWYHRKCLKFTFKKCKELIENQSFICSKKCESNVFPFYSIGDKAFIFINSTKRKFPCYKCTGECHRSMNRIKCIQCLRWAHLECINMPRSKADRIDSFYCSTKCELSTLPFYNLASTGLISLCVMVSWNLEIMGKNGRQGEQ